MSGPRTTAAAVVRRHGRVDIEELTLDEPGPDEVLVQVAAAGVCHSDLHVVDGTLSVGDLPGVAGHEGSGVVRAIGPDVEGVAPGDPVSFCFIPACGACQMCTAGRTNLCEPGVRASGSGTMLDGTTRLRDSAGGEVRQFLAVACFAEWAVVPRAGVVRIPPSLSLWKAALVGCAVVTGVGAVRNAADVKPGQSVCVVGCGGVGLQVIAAASRAGADPIVAVDVADEKLERAGQRGATVLVDARDDRPDRLVRKATSGGVDHALEVVGTPETVRLAWQVTRTGGQTTVVGVLPVGTELTLPASGLLSEKRLFGSFYGSGNPADEIHELATMVERGDFDVAGTVTHRAGLTGLNDALDRLRRGEGARTLLILDDGLADAGSLAAV